MSLKNIHRMFTINRVLMKHGLDEFLELTPYGNKSHWLKLFALTPKAEREKPRGQRLKEALIELGPIFIKFGQMLSTRRDLLPHDMAEELMLLQDKVEPFSEALAKQRIEAELKKPLDQLFAEFESAPMASASIAQVHAATLIGGEKVVVKVIRPGIRKQIARDLELLKLIAHWIESHLPQGKRFKPKQVVKDYEETIYNELDLRVEAANTMQLRRNFENSPLLYVPRVYWDFTAEKVMVQERIWGTPIGQVETLRAQGIDMKELAHRGVEIFFTQVFRDSFFHADMHPGNIFVDTSNPQKPKYIGIDCGIMGTLSQQDKRYLAENFLAFFEQDYRRIAELHIQSGWIEKSTSVEAFESAIRTACEPIFGKPLAEISFGQFMVQLFTVARRFNMEVQPQLVLLQKTLLYVEGLGRQLFGELDLWQTAQPFLKQWAKDEFGAQAMLKKVKQKWPTWMYALPDMPEKIDHFLSAENQRQTQQQALVDQMRKFETKLNQRGKLWMFLSLGSSLMILSGLMLIADLTNAAQISLVSSGLCFLLALRAR